MRIAVSATPGNEAHCAQLAESQGLFAVLIDAPFATETIAAAAAVVATTSIRIIVRLHVGTENPVTLAEEIAVLDNISNGRIGVVADTGELDDEAALEDIGLLRAAWSGRSIRHRGERWRIPAGIDGHAAPDAIMVTPKPVQIDIPLWLTGKAASRVGIALGVPGVAEEIGEVDPVANVSPGRIALLGSIDDNRGALIAWSNAGATHIVCDMPVDAWDATLASVVRWIVPEVSMVGFPRVVAEAELPLPWPRRTTA